MDRTAQLGLPLVMPAQAQKHVTVNEALAILDAVAQLRLASAETTVPPSAPLPGSAYAVPEGAQGEWAAHVGKLAAFTNGGWTYLTPRIGWQAWIEAEGRHRRFDGTRWIPDAVALTSGGSAFQCLMKEFDHALTPGPTNLTEFQIPANAIVFGVTGRVVEAIGGEGLSGWRLGVMGSDNRYGSGLGTSQNAFVHGLSGVPMTYYDPTPLLLTSEGEAFAEGVVRLCVAYIELALPRPV